MGARAVFCATVSVVFALFTGGSWAQPTAAATRELAVGADRFQRGAPVPQWVDRISEIPAVQADGPVVALLADTQFRVAGDLVYVHRAVVARTPASLDQVARFTIRFNPEYESVQLHTLRLRRDGQLLDRLADSRITFLQREVGLDNGIYTGDVTASIIIPDLRVGDVLETEYTRGGANPVLGGKFVQKAQWDFGPAIQFQRVTLLTPPKRNVHWRMQGGQGDGDVQPSETLVGDLRRLRWERRDVPRQEVDPGTPPSALPWQYLRFSEFDSWDDVTRWAEALFDSAQGDSPELQQLAAQFRQLPSDADRVSAALAWVQQQVRYISLSFGESSHRPSPAAVTLARRYGDCKDKSALLVQLLRNLGVQADPVLLSASHVRGLDKHLPSPDSFDHAIVRVQLGGDTYYLDPTRSGQSGRVANMGQAWDGAQVLVVHHGNSSLSEIKAEPPARTTMVVQERIVLTDWQKPGLVNVRMTWTGAAAEGLRVAFAELSDDRIAQSLLANYERRYPGHKIAQKLRIEDDKNNNTLAVQFGLAVPAPAVSETNRWVVRYEANNIEAALPLPPSSVRKQPLALPYRMSMRYGVEVQFPPGVSVGVDPTSSEYRPPGLYISRASSFRGNRAAMTLDLSVLQPQVDPKDMRKYMDWVEWLRGQSRSSWWVAKTDPKASAAAQPQTEETRVNKSIERLDAAIKSGRLQGDDVAYAYCERAINYSYKREAQKASEDLDRALRLNAGLPEVQKCAGFVMLRLDRLSESIDAYGQAIILGNPNSGAYLERGIAKVAAGRLESAEADFISSTKFNPLRKQYAQIWQAIVVRRQGRKLDADMSALAATSATGPWPAPMLALMGDAITPQELLLATDAMKGEERDIALVEANHAIGQWNLAHGDKAAAAEAFRKAIASGLIVQLEHESARRELANLGLSQ